jgi:hypothetical protein
MRKCGAVTFIKNRQIGWTEAKPQVPFRLRSHGTLHGWARRAGSPLRFASLEFGDQAEVG